MGLDLEHEKGMKIDSWRQRIEAAIAANMATNWPTVIAPIPF